MSSPRSVQNNLHIEPIRSSYYTLKKSKLLLENTIISLQKIDEELFTSIEFIHNLEITHPENDLALSSTDKQTNNKDQFCLGFKGVFDKFGRELETHILLFEQLSKEIKQTEADDLRKCECQQCLEIENKLKEFQKRNNKQQIVQRDDENDSSLLN